MMKINKMGLIISLLLICSSGAWAAAGISGTPHDLDSIAWAGDATEDNGEICVYCHTPHAANTAFAGAPLWNKNSTLSTANNGFILYGATSVGVVGATIASTVVGGTGGTVNPPSMACLSCHDGVSAVNSVVNAPGAGYSAGLDGLIGSTATTITNALLQTAGSLANLGGGTANLSNDHPISVPYPVGGTSATNPASLRPTTTDLTGWAGAATIDKLLRTTNDVKYVECGSCHDPHNGGDSYVAGSSVHFLRVKNTNSALCLGCHDK